MNYVTIKEAAEMIGIKKERVRKRIKRETIKGVKILKSGKINYYRIPVSEIERIIKERRRIRKKREGFLNMREAAVILGLKTDTTLRRLIRNGDIKGIKIRRNESNTREYEIPIKELKRIKSFFLLKKSLKNRASKHNRYNSNKHNYVRRRCTIKDIKEGFERFNRENGHYPSAREMDYCEYLPSARQLQRKFGGVVSVRKKLGLQGQPDYSKGKLRKKMAKEADRRAKLYEEKFYNFLISKIAEIRVHEHKILRPGNICCDFFIYTTKSDGIALDLFYAKEIHSLAGVINIKCKTYLPIKHPVYFIAVGNDFFRQQEIEALINRKKNVFPSNMKVFTESYFKNHFEELIENTNKIN